MFRCDHYHGTASKRSFSAFEPEEIADVLTRTMCSADPYFRFGFLIVCELFCGCGSWVCQLSKGDTAASDGERLLKTISGSERV
jgi:hypothetical protein